VIATTSWSSQKNLLGEDHRFLTAATVKTNSTYTKYTWIVSNMRRMWRSNLEEINGWLTTTYAPIVLFVYNRPQHTKQVVEALQKNPEAQASDLYIFSDGPKNQAADEAVRAVREYLQTIKGFKRVYIAEREANLGLAKSIISGVTDIVGKFSKIIVLEDDLVVSQYFLEYMNKALCKYQNEERIMQISAYMFPVDLKAKTDAVFLPFTTSWGWATWDRSWQYFDYVMSGYPVLQNDKKLQYKFNLDGAYNYYSILESQRSGDIDTWDIQWYLSVFMREGLVLHPLKSLVKNIGFDGSGMHCGRDSRLFTDLTDFRVLSFPGDLMVSGTFYELIEQLKTNNSLICNLKNHLYELFKTYLR
jgi:hypothetical protein